MSAVPEIIELLAACKAAYILGRSAPGTRLSRRPEPHCHAIRTRNTKRLVKALQRETDFTVPRYDSPERKMLFASFDIGLAHQQNEEDEEQRKTEIREEREAQLDPDDPRCHPFDCDCSIHERDIFEVLE